MRHGNIEVAIIVINKSPVLEYVIVAINADNKCKNTTAIINIAMK